MMLEVARLLDSFIWLSAAETLTRDHWSEQSVSSESASLSMFESVILCTSPSHDRNIEAITMIEILLHSCRKTGTISPPWPPAAQVAHPPQQNVPKVQNPIKLYAVTASIDMLSFVEES